MIIQGLKLTFQTRQQVLPGKKSGSKIQVLVTEKESLKDYKSRPLSSIKSIHLVSKRQF